MRYGLCNLGIVGIRNSPSDKSELVSQLLYGECFKLLEQKDKWSRIKLYYDNYEGWIDNKQFKFIDKNTYTKLTSQNLIFSAELISFIYHNNHPLSIVLGSNLNPINLLKHKYNGKKIIIKKTTSKQILKTAMLYINAPYLWGGKTPFGIDCSGYSQMVYMLNGIRLNRDASQQAKQGKIVQLNINSKAGDLAFFQNESGNIIHVGIIMENNFIIHSHGKVRIDTLDNNGIFNSDIKKYSHKLKFVKNYF